MIESSCQLEALPDLAAERGYDTGYFKTMMPEDALLDPWVPIKRFRQVGGVNNASVERAAAQLFESPVPPDPTLERGQTVLGDMLEDLARSQPKLHDHFLANFEALMDIANEVARAVSLDSVVWVVTEGALAPFGWTAVNRVLDRTGDPIPARLLASDSDEDGDAAQVDFLPGDVMIAFALSGRCPDFRARIDQAIAAGVAVGIVRPQGSRAHHDKAIHLDMPTKSGRHLVAADLLLTRMIAAVTRQLVGDRRKHQDRLPPWMKRKASATPVARPPSARRKKKRRATRAVWNPARHAERNVRPWPSRN